MDQPSEAQIKAGNYSKGHVYAHGMRISIENPADSVRSGVGKDGEPWDSRMQHDYGYIRGTEGADGDHMDVFLGPDFKSREVPVHVIDQHDEDGKFDEHKVMLGFKDKDAALRAYMGNYPDGYTGARAITPMHIDKFKEWMVGPGAKKSVSKVKKFADGGYTGWDSQEPAGPGYQSNLSWDQSTEPVKKAAAPLMSFADFKATVKPEMLNEQGQFKAPAAGVNFMLEGQTPESAYQTAQNLVNNGEWSEDNRQGKSYADQQATALLDTDWRTGPNNGGGFLGGIGNAGQGIFDGIRTNPAIMAALSAGVAPYVSKGLASAGMGAGAVKTVTPLIMNAGKTIIGGGSAADALKGAGTGYFTGQVGDFAAANNPIPEVLSSNVVKYLAGTAIKGKSADPFGLASAFLTGEAKKPVQKLADGGSIAESDAQAAKDVAHSTQVMKQMLRGWAAGTAGLPGDLEGLARKVVGWGATEGSPVDAWSKRDPVMPTSAFFKEYLPGHPDEPRLREAEDLGSLAGGAGVTSLARPLAKGAGALTKALAEAAPGPMSGSLSAQRGVIKAPGGNWLSGSVEDALAGLKKQGYTRDEAIQARSKRLSGIGVPEKHGPGMNSYGEPLSDADLIREMASPMIPAHLQPGLLKGGDASLNNWVDKQLARYVKNDMATERDPIRALAEQGTLHVSPDALPRGRSPVHLSGEVLPKLGQTPGARSWENASDAAVYTERAKSVLEDLNAKELAQNSWASKVSPDTMVNMASGNMRPQDLGLDHLADELRNAMNPESGLPRHLQLKPESLNSVSVPQAVKLVSDINKWRAEQKVIANKAVANNPATFTHKEYPDTGFKWVELKAPERKLPEGYSIEKQGDGLLGTYAVKGGNDKWSANTEQEALDRFFRRRPEFNDKSLKDALKYEGDTMGHCVGGYCDDVASGNTRILSLRDAKGEPHATVELRPGVKAPEGFGPWEQVPESVRLDMTARGLAPTPKMIRDGMVYGPDGKAAFTSEPVILQIKGKGNKGVADKYRPMVQDFLNTFEHSAAQDLQLNGMRATKDAWNAAELAKIKAAGIEVPRYATQAKIDDIGNIVWPAQWGAAK